MVPIDKVDGLLSKQLIMHSLFLSVRGKGMDRDVSRVPVKYDQAHCLGLHGPIYGLDLGGIPYTGRPTVSALRL